MDHSLPTYNSLALCTSAPHLPYSPQQNGTAERVNRTLMDMARSMLQYAGLPNSFWGDALLHAAWVKNRIPCLKLKGITPNKMCEDAQDLSYFGRADGQCEKISILNLRCRGLHAWVEIDQSHLLP